MHVIFGPSPGDKYQINGRTFSIISWRWAHDGSKLYTVEFEDCPGYHLEEAYTFDGFPQKQPIRCGLSVEEFHHWVIKQHIFEDLFGSHLHAQLLSNTGYNFVTYL